MHSGRISRHAASSASRSPSRAKKAVMGLNDLTDCDDGYPIDSRYNRHRFKEHCRDVSK